jgi:hypothetical protein
MATAGNGADETVGYSNPTVEAKIRHNIQTALLSDMCLLEWILALITMFGISAYRIIPTAAQIS